MRTLTRPLVALALGAAWLGSITAAEAQTRAPQAQPQAPGAAGQAAAIPDQKLDAAAAAIKQVSAVRQRYQQQIAAAQPTEQQRLVNEGNAAMVKAVTDQGLSVEEYDSIIEVAQSDPAVHAKIMQRLNTAQ